MAVFHLQCLLIYNKALFHLQCLLGQLQYLDGPTKKHLFIFPSLRVFSWNWIISFFLIFA